MMAGVVWSPQAASFFPQACRRYARELLFLRWPIPTYIFAREILPFTVTRWDNEQGEVESEDEEEEYSEADEEDSDEEDSDEEDSDEEEILALNEEERIHEGERIALELLARMNIALHFQN